MNVNTLIRVELLFEKTENVRGWAIYKKILDQGFHFGAQSFEQKSRLPNILKPGSKLSGLIRRKTFSSQFFSFKTYFECSYLKLLS